MPDLYWGFLDRVSHIEGNVSEDVAYSWTCNKKETGEFPNHIHTIECLWIWHFCNMSVNQVSADRVNRLEGFFGWKPGGVGLHTLVSISPLHLEASLYWPDCCGMHGWIRDGKWVSVW